MFESSRRGMCGLCCRNLVSHVHVALYTLSIGDNCCRNLVLHVCVVLYTLGTGKTYVVQDILQRLCLSAHFTVWRGEPPHASVQEPAGDVCLSPLEGGMCGLCCRNLVSHVHVALYTLSIGDNCCRNLVLHVCVVLYTLGTGKTYVVQDILQRLCLSAHFTVW